MSRKTIRSIGVVVTLATVAALTACGGGSSSKSSAPLSDYKPAGSSSDQSSWSKFTFTIGDNGGDGSEQLAKLSGVFDSAKYKVKFAHFTYGPPLIQAAASGDIDLGSVGDVPPITGAAKTFGFKVVAVERSLTPDQPQENIIVPKGSTIQTLAELKGKKIAVPQGSSAHGLALNALKSVGLTPNDVQLDFLAPAAGASAFAAGKVDAWAIWNPQSALAVQAGARILAKGLPPIDQTSSYYVASQKSLDDPVKRAALKDVLLRLAAEFTWGVKNPDQYAKALSVEEGISIADAKTTLKVLENRVTPVETEDTQAEQTLSDSFLEAGQISKKVDFAGIVDSILPAGFDSSTLKVD
jgi:sulfonate transport system substrate-binding protein